MKAVEAIEEVPGSNSDSAVQYIPRYVPLVNNLGIRTTIGFVLMVLSVTLAGTLLGGRHIYVIALITALAWLPAVFLTDKYVHKYPQRYFTYLIASHFKSGIIMAIALWLLSEIAGILAAPHDVLWTGFIAFVLADAVVSAFHRQDILDKKSSQMNHFLRAEAITDNPSLDSGNASTTLSSGEWQSTIRGILVNLDAPLADFIEDNLLNRQGCMNNNARVLNSVTTKDDQPDFAPVGLGVSAIRLNDVRRLNRFFLYCTKNIDLGGYFVGWYVPHEIIAAKVKNRFKGMLFWPVFIAHFIWYRAFPKIPWLNALYFLLTRGRNRVFSKTEIWGRLSYCGMRVITEKEDAGGSYILAQRIASPILNKRPSYYPIVALEKVGLDGEIMRTHKIRTMFPFSEFLQKRIFEDNGLAPTGKFAGDFRLTEYGRFLRKYWLDELPQIFDWLRGDIKLVGMRATSRHFLTLYPKDFYDLYVQIKPGLIPPIFDESTGGFEEIVKVELTYLQRYLDQPFRTDVRYLIQTLTDIVFRGIRSK